MTTLTPAPDAEKKYPQTLEVVSEEAASILYNALRSYQKGSAIGVDDKERAALLDDMVNAASSMY
jgi:hypothetical protein